MSIESNVETYLPRLVKALERIAVALEPKVKETIEVKPVVEESKETNTARTTNQTPVEANTQQIPKAVPTP